MALFYFKHSVSVRELHTVRYAGAIIGPVPPDAFSIYKDIL